MKQIANKWNDVREILPTTRNDKAFQLCIAIVQFGDRYGVDIVEWKNDKWIFLNGLEERKDCFVVYWNYIADIPDEIKAKTTNQ